VQTAVTVVLVLGTGPEGAAAEAAIETALEAGGEAAAEEASTFVVRGGTNTLEQFMKQEFDNQGLLREVSVQYKPGVSVAELSQPISRYGQVGVTTIEKIEALGGKVEPDPLEGNPYHCLLSGITAGQGCGLFTPTIRNPAR